MPWPVVVYSATCDNTLTVAFADTRSAVSVDTRACGHADLFAAVGAARYNPYKALGLLVCPVAARDFVKRRVDEHCNIACDVFCVSGWACEFANAACCCAPARRWRAVCYLHADDYRKSLSRVEAVSLSRVTFECAFEWVHGCCFKGNQVSGWVAASCLPADFSNPTAALTSRVGVTPRLAS